MSTTLFKKKLHEIIFEADTNAGKLFDVLLLVVIGMSVLMIMLESVPSIGERYGYIFNILEWVFTGLFTVEYFLRVWIVKDSKKYIFSGMGIIDFLATTPSYFAIFISAGQYFQIIRIFRLLRVFRILKLVRYMEGASALKEALISTRGKIVAFLVFILCGVVMMGTIMYVVESGENGFTSIPRSIYWAIVTLTTVGYGDITPVTTLGQIIASIIMVLGYGILAVPTGLVSVEAIRIESKKVNTQVCRNCNEEGHDSDAKHCKFCGDSLS
jgi:voltage-gated potassium channel